MTEAKRNLTRREISDITESVYLTTMEDDDYVLVSVQDPDDERNDVNPGVGLYMADDHTKVWGKFMPCWLVAKDVLGNWTVVTHEGRVVQFFGGTEVEGGLPTELVRARKMARGGIDLVEDELVKIREERPDIARTITVGATYVEGPRWALAYLADGLDGMTADDVEYRVGTNYFNEMTDAMIAFGVRNALKSYTVTAKRLRAARPARKEKGPYLDPT